MVVYLSGLVHRNFTAKTAKLAKTIAKAIVS
jgi:hypothetical protein